MDKHSDGKLNTSLKPLVKGFIAKYEVLPPTEDLSFVKDNIGKYPHDVNFFNNSIIKKRLKTLAGEQI